MNLKLKTIALVSALVVSLGLSAGAIAQDDTSGASVGITVLCSTANPGTSTASIVANGDANFESLDPSDSDQLALRSTNAKALRVVMNISSCMTGAWHVDASIENFVDGANSIAGTKFRLPIGGDLSSSTAATLDGDVPVPGVVAPSASFVTFGGAASPYQSSHPIASTTGNSTGNMYMDFTGELTNLDPSTADGTYEATIRVTFSPGAP